MTTSPNIIDYDPLGSILEQAERSKIGHETAVGALDELYTTGDAERIVIGSVVSAALVAARGAHRRMAAWEEEHTGAGAS